MSTEIYLSSLGKSWRWPAEAERREPKPGDTIEVRGRAWGFDDWTRVEVKSYGNSRDEYIFSVPWPIKHGGVTRDQEGIHWRWPEKPMIRVHLA